MDQLRLNPKNYKTFFAASMVPNEDGFHCIKIEASQEGSPYVYVTYANPNDFEAGADRTPPINPFVGIYITRRLIGNPASTPG